MARATTGDQGYVNAHLQEHFPSSGHVDRIPGARCRLWFHGKAVVRAFSIGDGRWIERYDCACGRWYWLALDRGPLVRFGNRP